MAQIRLRIPVQEYKYMVYREGDVYYAMNRKTKQIEFMSRDPAYVINQAIIKTSTAGGGVVFLKEGEYDLNELNIEMKSNVTLKGAGKATVIKRGYISFIDEGLENVEVRDLFIDNRGWGGCLWIAPPGGEVREGPRNVLVENVIAYGSGVEFLGGATVEVRGAKNVVFRNCEVAYGGHNGFYITAVDEENRIHPSEDILIENCYIHDNWDDAIDLNATTRAFVINNIITNNQYSCCSIEKNCIYVEFVGNYVEKTPFIDVIDSEYVLIASNTFLISAPTWRLWKNSRFITFVNNFYGSGAIFAIENCESLSIISNHLYNHHYNQPVFAVNSSRGFVIKNNYINTWSDETQRTELVHPFIIDENSSDYEVADNFIEGYSVCEAKFGGVRYRVKGNIWNRRGSAIAPTFHDHDGSMTGTTGTPFTFEDQAGEVTIDTSTAGVVSGDVTFPVRYPIGRIPKVLVTLMNVADGVVIDTVHVKNVTETGFTYSLRVVQAVAGTTCKLVWRASL